jgi:hypothetical protein
MLVTYVLQMKDFTLDKWGCLSKVRSLEPMGVDPFLQDTLFTIKVCLIIGFAG